MHTLLTPQEHILIGSTPGDNFIGEPYIPLIIQRGFRDISAVSSVRQFYRTFQLYGMLFEGGKVGEFEDLTLSSLDQEGRSIEDPKPVREDLTINRDLVGNYFPRD